MKKTGILNQPLSAVIGAMGHTDLLVIADAGFPVPPGVARIDLAVVPGLPGVVEVVRAIALELVVEALTVADELQAGDTELPAVFQAIFPDAPMHSIPHIDLKAMSTRARAVVRTGECTPYANLILTSGVAY